MTTKNHVILFSLNLAIWIVFFFLGLPNNHYQAWTLDMQLIHCGDIVLLIWPLVFVVLKRISDKKYFIHSLWFAFYASVPLALFDYIYLHLIKGYDYSYLLTHWYLTIFYFLVWIEIPLIGYYLEKGNNRLTILKRKESSKYYSPEASRRIGMRIVFFDDRTRPAHSDDNSRIIYRAERHDKAMVSKPFFGLTSNTSKN